MQIAFVSAYRQLSPTEKSFVDAFVADLEHKAAMNGERLLEMLRRPVSAPDARTAELLCRQLVQAAIAERVREIADSMALSAHRILKETAAIAFSSIGNYMEVGQDGVPLFNLSQCTPEQLSAIQSIEIVDNYQTGKRTFKFKMHDKIAGLQMFMRHAGLLDADNPHWRAEQARSVNPAVAGEPLGLPAAANDAEAADAYSRMING